MVNRTKRLTLERALKILQLRYGTQVIKIILDENIYIADFCGDNRIFTRNDILAIENNMYSELGA